MCVFYSQVFAMIVFLLISQIMAFIKRASLTNNEMRLLKKKDAYWNALLNNDSESRTDFLANESLAL